MFTIQGGYAVNWYSIFYLASSVLTFVFLLFLGWKKGYPLLSWILILTTGALFFIIGTKLITFRSDQWTSLLREGAFPYTAHKSALGGLLFAILGVELSRSWLRIREFVLDTYVLIVPLGMAIQKPGCLLAGCCFGTPTPLPWGIQYARGTAVHYHQWISNTIPPDQLLSLPVHPVPLYELIAYLMIFGALILLAPYMKKKGSRFLLALTLLTLSRFTLEFFRDPSATLAPGHIIGGLRAIQWILLVSGAITGFFFLWKLKRTSVSMGASPKTPPLIWRSFTWILLISLLMWSVHEGFSPTEMLVMNLKLLPALVLFGIYAWTRFAVPRFRLAGIFILIMPLIFMGQSIPTTEGDWQYFHSFGAGGTFGSYGEVARYNEHEGGCSGITYNTKYYDQNYKMATLHYSYSKQKGYNRVTYGGSIFGGINREQEIDVPGSTRHSIFGLHPYMDFNSRFAGFGLGAGIGYLNYIPTTPFDEITINSGIKTFPFLPSVKLRLGPYNIIDLEYKFLDEFPTQLPVLTHQLSLGSGFGMVNGSGLRIGLAPPEESIFVSANVLIKERFMIQAKYINSYFRYGNSSFLSFGLNYRLSAQPPFSN